MVKKRYAHIITGLFLILGIFVVYALVTATGAWHASNEVILTINSCDVTLQDAIDNEWLKEVVTPPSCLSEIELPDAYHRANEIILTIGSYDLTMQDAIDLDYFTGTGTISPPFSSPSQGHPATEIEVTVDSVAKTLQEAIDSGDFSCADNAGQDCGGGICMTAGKIACDGVTCLGAEIQPEGAYCGDKTCIGVTTCGTFSNVPNYCDDAGTCVDSPCNIVTNIAPRGTPCGTTEYMACSGTGACDGVSRKGCTTRYDFDEGLWWFGCSPFDILDRGAWRDCSTLLGGNVYTGRSKSAGIGIWTKWSHKRIDADPADAGQTSGDWVSPMCQEQVCFIFCWWDDTRNVYEWQMKPYGPGTP